MNKLWSQVLIAIGAGIGFGYFWPVAGAAMKPLADAFINIVRMTVAPVVFCTIVVGLAGMSDMKAIGRTLIKALGLFYVLTAISLVAGLVAVYAFQPGAGMNIDPAQLDTSVAAHTPNKRRRVVLLNSC